MKVFKYPIPFQNDPREVEIELFDSDEVLSCGFQGNTLMMWVAVHASNRQRIRKFIPLMTGEEMPAQYCIGGGHKFIGTVTNNGIVVHLFEVWGVF